MDRDPRDKNVWFNGSTAGGYLREYTTSLVEALAKVDTEALEVACRAVGDAAVAGRRVFSLGNGGSAAVAEHLSCDLIKGTHVSGAPVIEVQSMTSNTALYTAAANDFGFEAVFSTQLELLGREGDVLLAISSSGNSANAVMAVESARRLGMFSIGLTGFDGGLLSQAADASLHIPCANYGVVEDAHQILMHVLAQYLYCERVRDSQALN